jgi:CubicO group peptidase (beta-lactamase class C family)
MGCRKKSFAKTATRIRRNRDHEIFPPGGSMLQSRLLFCLALVLPLSCAVARAADSSEAHTRTGALDAESALATAGGTTFKGPRDWNVRRADTLLILDAPEGDSHIVLAELPAADAEAAAKAVWAIYRPEAKYPVRLVTARAARDGWEERKVINYETSPNEKLTVYAVVSRSGTNWSVLVVDSAEKTAAKRGAAVALVIQSLRPKGYVRETFAGRTPHRLDAGRIAAMRTFLTDAMKEAGVPGASFALLQDGAVVYEGGIGVRALGKSAPVDANTLFIAASNTKGMSTLLLATLVDQGKLRWDQPVVEVYPAFRLGSPEVTRQVLIRHLVCACTGLPRQDLEWIFEFKRATPASSLALLGTNSPTSGFGEVFQYNNLMAAAAGYIGGHLVYPNLELGAAYDRAMQERIFAPLGMTSTTFDMARAQRTNYASPHADDIEGRTQLASMGMNYSMVPHRPAGGAWSSAHDLIRYVKLEADRGKLPDGRQLVSSENLLMRRSPQVSVGEDKSYGMGLMTETMAGVPVVYHGGSMLGYKSNIYLLPEAGIGAVLLTNSEEGQLLLRPFLRRLLEIVYDGKPEAAEDVQVAVARVKADIAEQRKRLVMPADAGLAGKLAKTYRSAELGDLAVRRNGRDVVFDVGEWKGKVASRKNDDGSISFIIADPSAPGFEFVVAERDGKRVLIVRDGQHEYLFIERS